MSGIPSWAKVGAKVVCVDGGERPFSRTNLPIDGGIYTIVGVEFTKWLCGTEGWGAHLAEVARKPHCGKVYPFSLDRFRPVKTIEDDISEHFAILLRTPSKVDA